MSSESPDSVVDTVVLMYFLMVDEVELLFELLGEPIAVPRIVFDPDEPEELTDDGRSEIARSIQYHRRVSNDAARDSDTQANAARSADWLSSVNSLHERGRVTVLDLTTDELLLLGQLTSRESCGNFGLRFPLDSGEAACLALAVTRNLALATDDGDALTALESYSAGHRYERIRRLLTTAGENGLRTRSEANEIHKEMRRLGFWDTTEPFPEG
ncbi:MAG: hypothetical protein ACR2H3_11645 [Acidimicrobiales bacterium]